MKLTKREKILLSILGLLIFWWLVVSIGILPALNQVSEAKAEIQVMDQQKNQMKAVLERYQNIDQMIDKEKEKKSGEDFFYRNIDDVFIDRTLQALAVKHQVTITDNEIADPQTTAVDPLFSELRILNYPIRDAAAALMGNNQVEETEKPDSTSTEEQVLPLYSNTVMIAGPIENVMNFIEEIRSFGKSVSVSEIGSNTAENLSGDNFYDQVVINFYFIEDVED